MRRDKATNRIIYAPSDLIVFMESEFASWMDRFYLEHPNEVKPDEADEGDKLIAEKGGIHEAEYFDSLIEQGEDVLNLKEQSQDATIKAMKEGRGIIYQARLSKDNFAGICDFLIKVEGKSNLGDYLYDVWDTKLSRKPKPYFAIQLCCYAEMLEEIQGELPDHVGVVLGTREKRQFRTLDYMAYYQRLKNDFLEKEAHFDRNNQPMPDGKAKHRRWNSHAEKILIEKDHISLVANIRRSQIKKLTTAGITTMQQLSELGTATVTKMDRKTLSNLVAQARLQIASRGLDKPEHEVIPVPENTRRGLALLPPESKLDVFFDMEGYPHVEGGLEYLFGASYYEKDKLEFSDWWGHDRDGEKIAFEQFVDWVHARWRKDPSMHIYHYAVYETTALRRLMGSHATREAQVDELLRNNVFINLFTVVSQGLLVGTENYSIKSIEKLYRGKRDTEVATAMDSVVQYQKWIEEPDGKTWKDSEILSNIRKYNKDDCDSTADLAEWLRKEQLESKTPYVSPPGRSTEETDSEKARNEADAIARELLDSLPPDEPQRRLQELLAHLLMFHWREAKPIFWAMYDRHDMNELQRFDDANCLAGLKRTATSAEKVNRSLVYEYRFDSNQDTKLGEGSSCFVADDLTMKTDIYTFDGDNGLLGLKFGPSQPQPPDELSLIPDEFVNAKTISDSIKRTVKDWRDTKKLPAALEDFLLRNAPRIAGHKPGPIIPDGTDLTQGSIDAVLHLQNSTLCIQGPPGSGKTTTGAEIIIKLLEAGKTVGVTSNSHKAIANLLRKVDERASKQRVTFRGIKIGSKDEFLDGTSFLAGDKDKAFSGAFKLIGGTAWAFSAEAAKDKLDYLFIDEAGQVSIANLVGMAPSTKNIVIMGDQMQLGQPMQGAHPGESGQSILEYLLQEHQTIPADFGIFLGVTHRLHKDICSFISSAVYEDRLKPSDKTNQRRIVLPAATGKHVQQASGIIYVPVEHEGNTQGSEEEADVIEQIIKELRRCHFINGGQTGPITDNDILIVAPYNVQVAILKKKHNPELVGTVDKFQGQEKPIVIVSMCASNGNDSARGLDFLFNKNRLNVALSRAQCLAIVVGSPNLATTTASTINQMALVNLFCRIAEHTEGPRVATGTARFQRAP